MLERIDYTVKWYLRIVIGIYLLMFIPIFSNAFFWVAEGEGSIDALRWTGNELWKWFFRMPLFDYVLIILPFDLDIKVNYDSYLVSYIFWSFWLGTLIRWNITGKHFYQ